MNRYPQAEEGERRQNEWHKEVFTNNYTPEQRWKIQHEAEMKGFCRDCVRHKAETTTGRCQPCQDERDLFYEDKCNHEAMMEAYQ